MRLGGDPVTQTLPLFRPQITQQQKRLRTAGLLSALGLIGFFYGASVSFLPIAFYLYLAMPIAFAALIVIWALPDTNTYPGRILERLFFAILIATFIWPNYLAIALPGLPWLTLTRVLGLPLLLMLLLSLSRSSEFRRRLAEPFQTTPIVLKALLAFILCQFITLPMTNHIAESLNALLDSQIAWTAVFFVAAFTFLKPERPRIFAWLLCAIAVVLCVLAYPEVRAGQVLWTGEVPQLLQVPDESVQRIMAGGRRSALGIYRIQSIFSTALNFAEFIGLCTPFFLFILVTARHRVIRLAVLIYLPASFLVIRATDSRLGVVAFFASIFLYLLLWSIKMWRTNPRNLIAPAMVLSYPAVAGFFVALTLIWNRLGVLIWGGGAQQASNAGRKQQYIDALPKILANPFGNGIGEGASTLGDVTRVGFLTIDSYYLVLALEYGVLGFLAYATLIFAAIHQAVRFGLKSPSREADLLLPAAVFLIVFVIVKGVLAQDDNHSLTFMVLGMVVALAHKVRSEGVAAAAPVHHQGGLPS